MTAEVLLYHLWEMGATVRLSDDPCSLDIEAPEGVLAPELIELLREHKADIVELIYSYEERAAIEWEGCVDEQPRSFIKFEGDPMLIERVRNAPMMRTLVEALNRRGGGVIEVFRTSEALAA